MKENRIRDIGLVISTFNGMASAIPFFEVDKCLPYGEGLPLKLVVGSGI